MIRINLLPYRAARKKENVRQQVVMYVVVVLITCAGLYGVYTYLTNQINDYEQKIKHTKAEIKKFEEIIADIERIKERLEILYKRLEVIAALDRDREKAFRLLDAMTTLVVENRMWFESLGSREKTIRQKSDRRSKAPPPPPETFTEVTINGIAMDNKTVADFMTRLEGSNLFDEVKLGPLRRKEFKGKGDLKSFEIICLKKKRLPEEGEKESKTGKVARR